MSSEEKHIFICTGKSCHPEAGASVYQHLKNELKNMQQDVNQPRIRRSQSSCLGICKQGPIAVVYPDGIWYREIDKDKIERVMKEHLISGNPVKEWVFDPKDLSKDQIP